MPLVEIEQKIIPALGHLKIAKIKPIHLQSFYNNLLEDGVRKDGKPGGYSPVTIKKDHAILSSMLTQAVQWQLIESNPCDRVSPPKEIKIIAEDVKHYTLEQSGTFLNALEMEYINIRLMIELTIQEKNIMYLNIPKLELFLYSLKSSLI